MLFFFFSRAAMRPSLVSNCFFPLIFSSFFLIIVFFFFFNIFMLLLLQIVLCAGLHLCLFAPSAHFGSLQYGISLLCLQSGIYLCPVVCNHRIL